MPPLLANHPAYDYAARRYGWSVENYDLDPEAPLDPVVLRLLAATGRKFVLWESPPLAATVAALEAKGLKSIVITPCEQPPESGDWLTVMRENANKLAAIRGR